MLALLKLAFVNVRIWIAKYEVFIGMALFALFFYFGWHLRGVFYEAALSKQQAAAIKEHTQTEIRNNNISVDAVKQSSQAHQNDVKLNQEIQDEVKTKTVYVSCKLPASGVRLINCSTNPDGSACKSNK